MSGQRIVSLLPSATEIVAALDGLDRLVGRSHECDHPPGVEALPVCCRPRIDINAAGHEIDRQVKQRLAEAISIFEIDHRQLSELQPDLVLTTGDNVYDRGTAREVRQNYFVPMASLIDHVPVRSVLGIVRVLLGLALALFERRGAPRAADHWD